VRDDSTAANNPARQCGSGMSLGIRPLRSGRTRWGLDRCEGWKAAASQ
jgi:hypothetical protein